MDLDNAIKRVRRIVIYGLSKRFDKIYRLTTENINGYITQFDFKGKNLYTVGSSGDQAINANMYGCNNINIVDINPLARYYINMKLAAMLVFDYDNFINFIHKRKYNNVLSKQGYSKIRDCLSEIDIDSLYLWDYIYDNLDINMVVKNLFHIFSWEQDFADKYNPYLLNKDNYNLAKSKIKDLKINFICENILKLDKIADDVDNIMLSNIYDYHYNILKIRGFRKDINRLSKLLNDNGKMLVSYLYNTSVDYTLLDFCSDNVIEDARMYHFQGIKGVYQNNKITDTAIIYQKR